MSTPPATFRVLAIAPFKGQCSDCPPPVWIDLEDLPDAPSRIQVSVTVPVSKSIHPDEYLELKFDKVRDFRPVHILQGNPYLNNILEARNYVREARKKGLPDSEVIAKLKSWADLPPLTFPEEESRRKGNDPSSPIDEILKMVAVSPTEAQAPWGLKGLEAQLDMFLSKGLSEIFSCPQFKAVEASWQGLSMLAKYGARADIKLGILPATQEGLEESIDQALADLVVDLPSLILVDFPFDSSPRSMEVLNRVANLAETLMVPVLAWITHGFFHLESWDQLKGLGFLPHHLDQPAYGKWNELKKKASSRWLAVTCNRFLARFPYGKAYPAGVVDFDESTPPWMTPVWGGGAVACRSISRTGWPTSLTGTAHGVLEDLGLVETGQGGVTSTEFYPSRDRVDQFLMAGIVPLCPTKNKDQAFFPSDRTLSGGSLAYQLVLSRVVQMLLWCNEHLAKDLQGRDLETEIERVFIGFFEKTGAGRPERLQISVSKAEMDKRRRVSVALHPPRGILTSHEEIRLEVEW